jgi:hypothetical protein
MYMKRKGLHKSSSFKQGATSKGVNLRNILTRRGVHNIRPAEDSLWPASEFFFNLNNTVYFLE